MTLRDNAFVGCARGVFYDARGVGWMRDAIADPESSTLHRRLGEIPIDAEPWRSRYPTLAGYLTDRFGRPVGGKVVGTRLVDTPLGTIEDRECVSESGTVTVDRPAGTSARAFADDLIRRARTGTVDVGGVRVGPVGPAGSP